MWVQSANTEFSKLNLNVKNHDFFLVSIENKVQIKIHAIAVRNTAKFHWYQVMD